MFILLANSNNIKLWNIILLLDCDLNLILYRHIQESEIKYYDNSILITLIKNRKKITPSKKNVIFLLLILYNQKKLY